ncbi:hypothetical protein HZA96_06985 [Candidatus Woesearchaeota archaeon]|nr:hypothetical protein [Candidatus Woesearchaeota archaeon]
MVSSLETLVSVGNEITQNYLSQLSYYSFNKEYSDENLHFLYKTIYKDLLNRDLTFFSEDDIAKLITLKSSAGSSNPVFALYTSALLHILTEKNEQQGKRTIMHLKDVTMDYLFHYVQKADVIILENCKGNEVLACAGSYGGSVNTIILKHFGETGKNSSDVLSNIASHNGSVNSVILYDVKGSVVASGMASNHGKVNLLLADSVDSFMFGSNICKQYGAMDLCYLNRISGDTYLFNSAFHDNGHLNHLFVEDIFISQLINSGITDDNFISKQISHVNVLYGSINPISALAHMQQFVINYLLHRIRTDFTVNDVNEILKLSDSIKSIETEFSDNPFEY